MNIFSPVVLPLHMKNWSLLAVALAILFAGCSSDPKKDGDPDRPEVFKEKSNPLEERRKDRRDSKLDAEQLYRRARGALEGSDFATAIEHYDNLSKRHPFSDFTTQGELERIYALYRNFDPDRALSSSDRFLREHPRHPAVDYIYYLKGLTNFARDESELSILPVDETKSDVTSQRRAFDDFALLIQKFPNSRYAGDAYARMVYIRNRLSEHELHVVDFYVRRGAYVAAAKRAEQVIAQYPGTPASHKALKLLVECYELAGLEQQAKDARALRAAQPKFVAPALSEGMPRTLTAAAPTETPPPKRGFMSRVAGYFSPSSSGETEPGIEIIIPTGKSSTAADKDPAPAAAESPEPARKSSKLEVFYEPYDDATPAPTPAAKTPTP